MKYLVVLLCLTCTVLASLEEERLQWVNFKSQHAKAYQNLQEEKLRFSIFQQNLHQIQEHNKQYEAGNVTYFKAVNKFADRSREELLAMLKRSYGAGRPKAENYVPYEKSEGREAPSSIDWREKGAVSAIKDQSDCGSCWAFSATGVMEGFNYLKNGQMVLLSEQQLVDCDTNNGGCDGGDEGIAMLYVRDHGIQSESTYPYEVYQGTCRYNAANVVLNIQGFVLLPTKDEGELYNAVGTLGPISVALDASNLFFYGGGVFTDNSCSPDDLDHAVLAVGYGKDSATGLDYWIIKNSWGTNWGEAGYFNIQRGSNMCGIATECEYPIL